jgi:hypothetical protein
MTDGVKVDLNALTTFAHTLGQAADGHYISDATDGANLAGLTGLMKASTGAQDPPSNMCVSRSGFLEAQDFATRHDVMAQSVLEFVSEALNGVVNLAAAAETCAVRYAGTDAANATLMHAAGTKFDKDHVFSGMTPAVSGTGVVTLDGVIGAFTPAGKNEALALPGSSTTETAPPAPAATTKASADDAFAAEVAQKKQALKSGQNIDPGPAKDPGDGLTIGQQPDALVVPADSVKLPSKPEIPVVPVVPKTGG